MTRHQGIDKFSLDSKWYAGALYWIVSGPIPRTPFLNGKIYSPPRTDSALLVFSALVMAGIIKPHDIPPEVNWDIVNFLAVAISLTAILIKAGISDWARQAFLLITTIMFWAIRLVDVPWGYATIASPPFTPLSREARASSGSGNRLDYCDRQLILSPLSAAFRH